MWSTPSVNVWSEDWKFPNTRPDGDGAMSFPNERSYRKRLKELGADEKSLGIREV
jgi:hypothetical protein